MYFSSCPVAAPVPHPLPCWTPLRLDASSLSGVAAERALRRLVSSVARIKDRYAPLNLDLVHLAYRAIVDLPLTFWSRTGSERTELARLQSDLKQQGPRQLSPSAIEYIESALASSPEASTLLASVLACAVDAVPPGIDCAGANRLARLRLGVANYFDRWFSLDRFLSSGWSPSVQAFESDDAGVYTFAGPVPIVTDGTRGCVLWVRRDWLDPVMLEALIAAIGSGYAPEQTGAVDYRSIGGPGLGGDPSGLLQARARSPLGYVLGVTMNEGHCALDDDPAAKLENLTGLVLQPLD